jgi:hypothetical protein
MSDKIQEPLNKSNWLVNGIKVSASRILIPRSGYVLQPNVAARRLRWVKGCEGGHNPIGVEPDWNSIPQGSRGGNPGLEVVTASRYLIRTFLQFVVALTFTQVETTN